MTWCVFWLLLLLFTLVFVAAILFITLLEIQSLDVSCTNNSFLFFSSRICRYILLDENFFPRIYYYQTKKNSINIVRKNFHWWLRRKIEQGFILWLDECWLIYILLWKSKCDCLFHWNCIAHRLMKAFVFDSTTKNERSLRWTNGWNDILWIYLRKCDVNLSNWEYVSI